MGQPPKGIRRVSINLNTTGKNAVLLEVIALRENSVREVLSLVLSTLLSGSTLGAALQDAPEPHLHHGGSPACETGGFPCKHIQLFLHPVNQLHTHTLFYVVSKALLACSCPTVSGR